MSGGIAAARAISAGRRSQPEVVSLQDIHGRHPTAGPARAAHDVAAR
jgi:hypothetical protein